VAFTNKNLT